MDINAYVAEVPHVSSSTELASLIRRCIGVAHDHRLDGLQCDPESLAQTLWSLKGMSAKTFAEIGTGHGYAFVVIHEFLKAHINPSIVAHTFDTHNRVLTNVEKYVVPYRTIGMPRTVYSDVAFVAEGMVRPVIKANMVFTLM
jgi:hypothetical protein